MVQTLPPPPSPDLLPPPSAGDQVLAGSTQLNLGKVGLEAVRVLYLNNPEDGVVTEASWLGHWVEANLGKDEKLQDRSNDPTIFANAEYRGNHLRIEPTEDQEAWIKAMNRKDMVLSETAIRRLWHSIKARSKAKTAMLKFLGEIPKRPHGMAVEKANTLEPKHKNPETGSSPERGPSIYDFAIDIDKIESSFENRYALDDSNGRAPNDPNWKPTFETTKDINGRKVGEDGYIETFKNRISVEEVRDYLTGVNLSDTKDPEMEQYLRNPFEREATGLSLWDKWSDSIKARAHKFLTSKVDSTKPWSIETVIAEANKHALEVMQKTTGTGPDGILRLLMKYNMSGDNDGRIVDFEGDELTGVELEMRKNILKLLRSDSGSYVQALATYEFTKNPHQDYYKFFERYMDVLSVEFNYSKEQVEGAVIGLAYSHKSLGNVAKNSMLVYREMLDRNGNTMMSPKLNDNGERQYLDKEGNAVGESEVKDLNTTSPYRLIEVPYTQPNGVQTIVTRRVNIETKNELTIGADGRAYATYTDHEGNAVSKDQIIDFDGRSPYHEVTRSNGTVDRVAIRAGSTVPDEQGNPQRMFLDARGQKIREDKILGLNTANPYHEVTAGGTTLQIPVDISAGELPIMIARKIPKLIVEPATDKSRYMFKELKLREWVMEVGSRMSAQQFAFEPAQMEDILEKVIEISMVMRRSFYEPNIQETNGKRIRRTRWHGTSFDDRRFVGRKSAEFAEMQTAAHFLWSAFSELLTNTPGGPDGGGGGDGAQITPEQLNAARNALLLNQKMNAEKGGYFDPRMYGAGGISNKILADIAHQLQFLMIQFPSATETPHGDYYTLEQRFKTIPRKK